MSPETLSVSSVCNLLHSILNTPKALSLFIVIYFFHFFGDVYRKKAT